MANPETLRQIGKKPIRKEPTILGLLAVAGFLTAVGGFADMAIGSDYPKIATQPSIVADGQPFVVVDGQRFAVSDQPDLRTKLDGVAIGGGLGVSLGIIFSLYIDSGRPED